MLYLMLIKAYVYSVLSQINQHKIEQKRYINERDSQKYKDQTRSNMHANTVIKYLESIFGSGWNIV